MLHDVQPSSSNCPEPLKRFLATVQTPEKGSFDFAALQWTDKVITKGNNQGKFDQEAYNRTDRVQDFIHGEELRASTSFYNSPVRASQLPSDLKRLQANSYLQPRTLHCIMAQRIIAKQTPASLMQPARAANKRCGKTERGRHLTGSCNWYRRG
ncbi:TPA: hypothetical protein ACH3X1_000709 [Trebouxia sp. C0004]